MLTFEKVLEVFHDAIEQDPLYEVVLTSHGYTLMAWEPMENEWYSARFMETPEILRDALAEVYVDYLTDQITKSADDRELTDEEQAEIDAKRDRLLELCEES